MMVAKIRIIFLICVWVLGVLRLINRERYPGPPPRGTSPHPSPKERVTLRRPMYYIHSADFL